MSPRKTLQWQTVQNTVADRLLDDSLMHTLKSKMKINKKTKLMNKKLKKCRIVGSYNRYLTLIRQVRKECKDGDESEDEPILSHDEYKKIHNAKPKTELKRFLRLCKLPKKRIAPQKSNRKTATLEPKKSPVGRTKPKLFSKSNNPKTSSNLAPSTPSSKKPRSSKTNRTIDSQVTSNPSQSDVQRVYNEGEKLTVKKIVKDLIASSQPRDRSLESEKAESAIERVETAGNLSEEKLDAEEQRTEVSTESKDYTVLDEGLKSLNGDEQDISAVRLISNSTEVFHGDRLLLQADEFMIHDEELYRRGSLSNEIDDDKFPDVLNHDSGNNSLSDADVFRQETGDGMTVDEATEYNDSIDGDIFILPDDLSAYEKSVLRLHGLAKNVRFDKESNISWLDLRHERPIAEDVVSESSLDSDASEEIALAKTICVSQRGDEPVIPGTPSSDKSKVKIRMIEQYENGRVLTKCQLLDQQKLDINNCIEYTSQNESPFKSSESCNLSEAESNQLNRSLDYKDCSLSFLSNRESLDVSIDDELICEGDGESEGDKSSAPCEVTEVESQLWNLSSNSSLSSFFARSYDEDVKNSVKAQLMLEIDQRLTDSPSSKKCRTSDTESLKLDKSLPKKNAFNKKNINELFDDCSPIEETESNDKGCTDESNPSEIQPQRTSRTVNIDAVSSQPSKSTPTKRQLSSGTVAEPSMFDALYSGKPTGHQMQRIRDLGWFPCESKSPEATSHESQLSKKRNDSDVKKTRKKRPKNLEDFVDNEELYPDSIKPYFRLKDIDDDEEIWIMDVPKTINPEDLENRIILLGGRSELKIGEDCYEVFSKPSHGVSNVSCVFAKSRQRKEYEIANVESKGRIKFRQKLLDVPDTGLTASKTSAVPFPKNLKIRHPLFGASYEDKI